MKVTKNWKSRHKYFQVVDNSFQIDCFFNFIFKKTYWILQIIRHMPL